MTLEQRIADLERQIIELKSSAINERYVSPSQLADIFNCSTNHIYVQIRKGRIKTAKNLGSPIRIPMSQFSANDKKNRRKNYDEPDEFDLMQQRIWG